VRPGVLSSGAVRPSIGRAGARHNSRAVVPRGVRSKQRPRMMSARVGHARLSRILCVFTQAGARQGCPPPLFWVSGFVL